MFGPVLACSGLCWRMFGPHPVGMLELVGTCGGHWRLVRQCRTRMGSKLPATPARFLPAEH